METNLHLDTKNADAGDAPTARIGRLAQRFRAASACLLLFALFLIPASHAQAALVEDLGTIGPGDSDFTLRYRSSGAFVDDYTFRVSEPVNIEAAAASFNVFGIINISDFTASLFEGTLANPQTNLATDSGVVVSLSAAGLQTDTDYFFRVTGVADGLFGGVYEAEYEVSAVPLPPALVLFLSALLGLIGLGRLKRRRAAQAG